MAPPIQATMQTFFDRWQSLQQSIERSPIAWNDIVHTAVLAKRSGDDASAVAIYVQLMLESGTLYSGLLGNLYKPLACSGHLREAAGVLLILERVLDNNPVELPYGLESGPSSYDVHYPQLQAAIASRAELEGYLAPLAGRPEYSFPRDFSTARRELLDFIRDGARLDTLKSGATTSSPSRGSAPATSPAAAGGGACYIATAVYGSYDAPEVRVLRTFRDEVLAASRFGRTATRAYYLASPPLAKVLRSARGPNRAVRWMLDLLVGHLRTRRAD